MPTKTQERRENSKEAWELRQRLPNQDRHLQGIPAMTSQGRFRDPGATLSDKMSQVPLFRETRFLLHMPSSLPSVSSSKYMGTLES